MNVLRMHWTREKLLSLNFMRFGACSQSTTWIIFLSFLYHFLLFLQYFFFFFFDNVGNLSKKSPLDLSLGSKTHGQLTLPALLLQHWTQWFLKLSTPYGLQPPISHMQHRFKGCRSFIQVQPIGN